MKSKDKISLVYSLSCFCLYFVMRPYFCLWSCFSGFPARKVLFNELNNAVEIRISHNTENKILRVVYFLEFFNHLFSVDRMKGFHCSYKGHSKRLFVKHILDFFED